MESFEQLRQQMVKNQLMPEGVLSAPLLRAFAQIPREFFVPEDKKSVAYQDEKIQVAQGRYLERPTLLARLFEAAAFQKTDRVLYIGALTGYGPALLSDMVQEIVAVEKDPFLFAEMQKNQARLKLGNLTALKGDFLADYAAPGLYRVIFIEGAVQMIPESLSRQLLPQGFVLTVIQDEKKGDTAVKFFPGKDSGDFQPLFYAATPFLASFCAPPAFTF